MWRHFKATRGKALEQVFGKRQGRTEPLMTGGVGEGGAVDKFPNSLE